MDILTSIASKIAELLVEPSARQLGYLVSYEANIKALVEETEKLNDKRAGIQLAMGAATRKSQVIAPEVLRWITEVDNMKNEVERFLEEDVKANQMLLNGWLPNLKLQHYLGRKSKKNTEAVLKLIQEGKFDRISYPAPPTGFHFAPYMKTFASRTKILNQVMEALWDGNIHNLAICGMGGVGKTTMAKEVGRRAKVDKLFDEVVMATVTQNPDVMRIQGEIKDALGFTFNTETQIGRAGELRNRIKNIRKILIILDDIWQRLDLDHIGIPFRNEHPGCIVLLTSRSEEVVRNQMRSQRTFIVQVLAEDEAWNLFEEVAGTSINTPNVRPIANQIAKECRGLPVAIVTLGSALKHGTKEEWKNALRQLRKSIAENISEMNANLYGSIELSYNFLKNNEAKSCFLLCCLFPEDHDIPIETLVRFGEGLRLFQGTETMEEARCNVQSLVHTLKRCFLLLDSNKEDCVKMHDIVRDVAISIASKKEHGFVVRCDNELEEWPEIDRREDCTTFSLVTNKIKKSLDSLRCPNLKLLHLSMNLLDQLEFNKNFSLEMKELKVLALQKMHIQLLPSSLQVLQNLKTLHLEYCVLKDISSIGTLVKLEILSLVGSEIQELPMEMRHLQHLKLLDITDCEKLKKIPPGVLSSLTRLEELYMRHSFNGWSPVQVNKEKSCASLDELIPLSDRLKVLDVYIPQVQLLPRNLVLKNLSRFRIYIRVDRWIASRNYLFENILCFRNDYPTDDLIESGINLLMNKCEKLALQGYQKHFNQLHEVGFSMLKILRLYECWGTVEYLMDLNSKWTEDQVPFPILEELYVGHTRLKGLCHPDLLQKKQMQFQREVLAGFKLFRNLKVLGLWDCHELRYVFSTYLAGGSLPQLQNLRLNKCQTTEVIVYKETWENDDNISDDTIVFPALTTLKFSYLQRLISLYSRPKVQESSSESIPTLVPFKCIKWLPNLEKLEITGCPMMRVVFDFHGLAMPLPEKEKANPLPEKENSNPLPEKENANSKQVAVHEKEEEDQQHWCLKCIPARKDKTVQGNKATTSSHSDAQREVRSTGRDDGLVRESSYPYGNYNTNGTDKELVFHNLNSLEVFVCNSVVVIFDFGESQGLFPPVFKNLSEMRLGYLPKLMHIWNIKRGPQQLVFISGFQNLRTLHIEGCKKLTNIFPASVAKLLVMLEQMKVEHCGSLQVIVAKEEEEEEEENVQDVVISFPYLRSISLKKLENLSCFSDQPNCVFRFPSLEKILIKGCYKLEKFVTAAAATSAEDTPKLKQVEDRDLPPPQRNNWLGNLNTTIQHNFQLKQVRQKENPKKKEVLMGTEVVKVDEISFPSQITTTKPLSLLGHGITDIEIHFLQIKFTAIGVYLDPEIVGHLQQWKGKKGSELADDDDFFEALISAPVEKFLRVVVIKEIKGSQYGVQLESAVRDRLAADDKYEEEEEAALEKVVEFFQSKYLKKDSIITYHFPATSPAAEIVLTTEGKEDSKLVVENANVVEMIKKWYLGGTRGVSSTTISSLAHNLSAELSK
ncbi:hypothetical protein FNV43_RR24380 [Rhamnella rubrinervis]|uniref:Chalcone-flavonone isomerase family protein n=1 Tax=Rhamnella rubrinervis TaxID=2594499 RepID=A0A8K0DSB3_9ROSA|nr:hypothetical protein FNV43_RR24380 [Rhamnella rubrinervis]